MSCHHSGCKGGGLPWKQERGKTEAANEGRRDGLLLPQSAVALALAAVLLGDSRPRRRAGEYSLGWVTGIFSTCLKGYHGQ